MENKVIGAEGIIIKGDKIVLGMQKQKRWYNIDGKFSAIIKTIGGAVELVDNNISKNALIRELFEEIKNIEINDIDCCDFIFTKRVKMGDLNPFDESSSLEMEAEFYLLKISDHCNVEPNDLPFLIEIPIKDFINLKMHSKIEFNNIKDYVIKNKNIDAPIPDFFAFFIPDEIVEFLKDNY